LTGLATARIDLEARLFTTETPDQSIKP
jgi:hypothetical protein